MTAPARRLVPIHSQLVGWLAKNEKGEIVTRSAQCVCGKVYQQSMLNPSFIDAKPNIAKEFLRQIPDGWVPVYCPPCESRELGRLGNRVSIP